MSDQLARRVLDTVTNIMDFIEDGFGNRIWWCHCFGGMLEYISDKTFSLDYDIDLGVIYGECDEMKLTRAFEGHGYKSKVMCKNDVTGKAFNIHFKPIEDNIKDTPTIDVYFWYPHGDKYYHTYDMKKEGKPIPSEYVFKGVKKHWLRPPKEVIERERHIGKPGREQLLTSMGTWNFPVFGDSEGLSMRLPFAVGHLLDEWYGASWRFREYYRGQSRSRWIRKMKSCKEWSK
jgi:hypothetical protein